MRLKEFSGAHELDRFIVVLKNLIGRAASKKEPAQFNWNALQTLTNNLGIDFQADYDTFKAMHDANPVIQGMVKNFNDKGIELDVPGVGDDDRTPDEKSQDAVDKIAAQNAEKNL